MLCPHCQTDNRAEARFCDRCGFPLVGKIAEAENENRRSETAPESDDVSAANSFDTPENHLFPSSADIAEISDDLPEIVPESELLHASHDLEPANVTDTTDAAAARKADEPENVKEASSAPAEKPNLPEETDATEPSGEQASDKSNDDAKASDKAIEEIDTDENPDLTLPDEETSNAQATKKLQSVSDEALAGNTAVLGLIDRRDITLKIPPIEDALPAQSQNFIAGSTASNKRLFKIAFIVLVALLCLSAICVGGSYAMELWGGKTVIDVVGMTEADAVDFLEAKGFSTRIEKVKSDDTAGIVLQTIPEAGARVEEGSEVVIQISVARVIPDVEGQNIDDAIELLEKSGFTNIIQETQKSDEEADSVLAMTPAQGTQAKSSDEIVLTVAVPFRVPDVSGKSLEDAVKAIEDEGFVTDTAQIYTDNYEEGSVVGTDPKADTALASGSTVTIQIAKSRKQLLIDATYSYFESSDTFTIGGVPYEIDFDTLKVSYEGYGVTAYSIRARKVETVSTLLFGSYTIYGNYETLTGTIQWSDSNTPESGDPSILSS